MVHAQQETGQMDRLKLMVHLFHCQSCCRSLVESQIVLLHLREIKRLNQEED